MGLFIGLIIGLVLGVVIGDYAGADIKKAIMNHKNKR